MNTISPETLERAPNPIVVNFDNLNLGTVYKHGDSFQSVHVTVTVREFKHGTTWTNNGYAKVGNKKLAGGSGRELVLNNVNLAFDIGVSIQALELAFGHLGGSLNIAINGKFKQFGEFEAINGTKLGNVNITAVPGGTRKGTLRLHGEMKEFVFRRSGNCLFVIGGQELAIDNVALHQTT